MRTLLLRALAKTSNEVKLRKSILRIGVSGVGEALVCAIGVGEA